jgi:hypothetical protein
MHHSPDHTAARLLLTALLLGSTSLAAQSGGWRIVPAAAGETSGQARLVLAGTDRRRGASPHDTDSATATLVIACGTTLPGPRGRALYFRSAEPMEPFGGDGYATLHFDGESYAQDAYLGLTADAPEASALARASGPLRLGFLGEARSPYYSTHLMREMLNARRLTVTYLAFGAQRDVTFHLAGLSEALAHLGDCDWRR